MSTASVKKKKTYIFVHIIRNDLTVNDPSRRDSAFRDCATIIRTLQTKASWV